MPWRAGRSGSYDESLARAHPPSPEASARFRRPSADSVFVHHLPHDPSEAETEDDDAGKPEDDRDDIEAGDDDEADDEQIPPDEHQPEVALAAGLDLFCFPLRLAEIVFPVAVML